LSLLFSSPATTKIQVKLAKHKSNLTLNPTNGREVNILSVSSEGQLLVGQSLDRHRLHVYSADCSRVTPLATPHNDTVYDAVWTPRGNIVYTEYYRGKVVTLSQSGDVIQLTNVSHASYLSVSTDGVIYLTSLSRPNKAWLSIVYQSTDDGLTWSHMFNISDDFWCNQVIKVSTDRNTDVLWTKAMPSGECRLRVYTVDRRSTAGNNVTWHYLAPSRYLSDNGSGDRLVYDGHDSIFVSDRFNIGIHTWSVSGKYDRQLVSRQQFVCPPAFIAVDTQRHIMYVVCAKGIGLVEVFELTYGPM
jgi:hypothetical protein